MSPSVWHWPIRGLVTSLQVELLYAGPDKFERMFQAQWGLLAAAIHADAG